MKRIYYSLLMLLLCVAGANSQVTIGAQSDPQAFSILELISDGTRGLRLPQLTTLEKDELEASPVFQTKKTTDAVGLMIFNTDTKCVEVWSGSEWISRCEEDQYICDTPAAPGAITFAGADNALNLNATFTAEVTAVSGMTYNWILPYGMEIAINNNNKVTIRVTRAGVYPQSLISVTATNGCGNTSAATVGNSASSVTVNNCTTAPTLTSAAIAGNTVVSGAKSGSGTSTDPYTVYVGQTISLIYVGAVPGETYTWSLNTNGTNHFSEEKNNGVFLQLRAKNISSTCADDAIGLVISNECGSTSRTASTIYIKVETISYPTITEVVAGNSCGAGTVTLSATASAGSMVRWYEAATGGAVLSTQNTFTTPLLSTATVYYAEAYNVSENTTSLNRTPVLAMINIVPTVSKVQDASRAGAGTVSLTDCATTPTSGASVRYFSVATGGTALTNNTTGTLATGVHTFYAEAYTSTCVSAARVAITVTVTPGTGMVALPDPESFTVPAEGTDANRTTPIITVTNPDCLSTGSYSFVVKAGTYASIVNANTTAGTFSVRFQVNTAPAGRAAIITVTDPCGTAKDFTFTQDKASTVAVSSVTITNTESSVNIGQTLGMTATVSPTDATDKTITWAISGGGSYASINASTGLLTPSGNGTGTVTVTATAGGITTSKTITILSQCGAWVNAAKTQWLAFQCYNLGATENGAPFTPAKAIHGAKYQWGKSAATVTQTNDQSNSGEISGWSTTAAADNSWTDTGLTNNPCPTGWRVPTSAQWTAVLANNAISKEGSSWSNNADNYDTGMKIGNALFLPAAGYRAVSDGSLDQRGSYGMYWSSTGKSDGTNSHYLSFSSGIHNVNENGVRFRGISVRCVAQ